MNKTKEEKWVEYKGKLYNLEGIKVLYETLSKIPVRKGKS